MVEMNPWIEAAEAVIEGRESSVHLTDTIRNVQRSTDTLLGHEVTPSGHVARASIECCGTGQLCLRGCRLKGFGIALHLCHACHLSTLSTETPAIVLIISCEPVTLSPPTTTLLAKRVFATLADTFPYGLLRD